MSNGKDFVIRADATSATNKYVQSATLNGATYDKAYFKHSDLAAGAILDLSMGGNVSSWATTTRPPSFSDDSPAGTNAR